MLVTRIKDKDGNLVDQQTLDFHLKEESVTPPPSGEYDFVFPEGLSSYTAGTKVLASDGAIYQCKPFPYSGYCSTVERKRKPIRTRNRFTLGNGLGQSQLNRPLNVK